MLIKYIVQISNDLCKSHTGEVKKSQCRAYGVCVLSRFSCIQLFATLWIIACQAPLSMGFPRQEYWSILPFPPPGGFSDPGIKPKSLTSPALAGGFFTTSGHSIKVSCGHSCRCEPSSRVSTADPSPTC